MKKNLLLILLLLLSSILLANDPSIMLKSYSTDEHISISHISEYASSFKIEKQEEKDYSFVIVLIHSEDESTIKQNTSHNYRWIMLELDANLSSGNYWVEHTGFKFTEHTFNKAQSVDTFFLFGRKFFSFRYDKLQDSKRYFLKTVNAQSHAIPMTLLYTPQTFSI